MTKKLEEIFDLEPKQTDEEKIDVSEPLPVKADIPEQTLNNIEKIEAALPRVKGLEAGDSEMDELSELAQKSYKDLMDLGMNVDSRFSAEIFSVAANLLNHSISAKTAKINKKLKMVDLQLKQAQLEQKERALAVKQGEDVQQGEGVVLDRNELLQELLKKEPPKE